MVVDMSAVSGAIRIPANAATEQPSAQAKLESTDERAPSSAASSRLSTTARIAMPIRVRTKRMRNPIASATATMIVMNRCQVSNTSPMWNPRPAKSCGIECALFWFQIMFARPTNAKSNPTVTMSCTTSCLPCRWRMIARSSPIPSNGAMTSTTSGSATACGTPCATVSSQSTYARNMPIAPWAKLNTPVVV